MSEIRDFWAELYEAIQNAPLMIAEDASSMMAALLARNSYRSGAIHRDVVNNLFYKELIEHAGTFMVVRR